MKNIGIYQITNLITGDFYIGQSVVLKRRLYRHTNELRKNYHCNQHLQRAFNKYGETAFSFRILLICEQTELTYYEQRLVTLLKPTYNIKNECSVSGGLGFRHTEEEKLKISDSQKGKNGYWFGKHQSEESNRKRSDSQKGKHMSEEFKRKLSERNIGNKYNLGKPRPQVVKDKISATKTGNTFISEETKRKISETKLRKKLERQTEELP